MKQIIKVPLILFTITNCNNITTQNNQSSNSTVKALESNYDSCYSHEIFVLENLNKDTSLSYLIDTLFKNLTKCSYKSTQNYFGNNLISFFGKASGIPANTNKMEFKLKIENSSSNENSTYLIYNDIRRPIKLKVVAISNNILLLTTNGALLLITKNEDFILAFRSVLGWADTNGEFCKKNITSVFYLNHNFDPLFAIKNEIPKNLKPNVKNIFELYNYKSDDTSGILACNQITLNWSQNKRISDLNLDDLKRIYREVKFKKFKTGKEIKVAIFSKIFKKSRIWQEYEGDFALENYQSNNMQ